MVLEQTAKKVMHKLAVIAIMASIPVLQPGCVTSETIQPSEAAKLEAIASIVEMATAVGVQECQRRNPESTRWFAVAGDALAFAVANETLEPSGILNLLDEHMRKAGYADAAPMVRTALQIALTNYSAFHRVNGGDKALDKYPDMKRLLIAIQRGLTPRDNVVSSAKEGDMILSDSQLKL